MGVDLGERDVLLALPTLTPPEGRECAIKMLMEDFGAASACVAPSAVLALYSSGKATDRH